MENFSSSSTIRPSPLSKILPLTINSKLSPKLYRKMRSRFAQLNISLEGLGIPVSVVSQDDCIPEIWVLFFEKLYGRVPDIIRHANTPDDHLHNLRIIIGILSYDIIKDDLSHISLEGVRDREIEPVLKMIEIFVLLQKIPQEHIEPHQGGNVGRLSMYGTMLQPKLKEVKKKNRSNNLSGSENDSKIVPAPTLEKTSLKSSLVNSNHSKNSKAKILQPKSHITKSRNKDEIISHRVNYNQKLSSNEFLLGEENKISGKVAKRSNKKYLLHESIFSKKSRDIAVQTDNSNLPYHEQFNTGKYSYSISPFPRHKIHSRAPLSYISESSCRSLHFIYDTVLPSSESYSLCSHNQRKHISNSSISKDRAEKKIKTVDTNYSRIYTIDMSFIKLLKSRREYLIQMNNKLSAEGKARSFHLSKKIMQISKKLANIKYGTRSDNMSSESYNFQNRREIHDVGTSTPSEIERSNNLNKIATMPTSTLLSTTASPRCDSSEA
ncbi:10710_t:CDS:2 [Diversispora eburnea]|uniref:10710_t:CDS:1 n=1 Tax=Diversispora eburnea TaxID=1213867 RepID=A0A9N8UYD4_9GLOM|nr:10710_t:CDS:2 [Diversispora eburnea]